MTENDAQEVAQQSLEAQFESEPIENFNIGKIIERDIKQGKEVKVRTENDEWYAGEWVRKRLEASREVPTQPTWVGYSTSDLLEGVTEIPIEFGSLFRHMAIFGTTGYGKSTLLKNIMIQWAHAGYGFVYIDPKGDDVYELMQMLPEERLDDVIWIEPGSKNHDQVVGINFLEAGLSPDDPNFENEVNSIIDDLEDILRSEEYWGPTMSAIIQNVGGWMVRQEENFSMLDLYMLLANEEERAKFAENVEDEVIKQYAQQVSNKDQREIDALLKRIQKWVESPVTREIVAHRESSVNLTEAVEDGKIILVRSAAVDRKDIKRAVATGIIRRVWSAIKSREGISKPDREPFFLVVDEFDDVASEDADIDKMLSKARSYRLGIVLANQQPHQLPSSIVSAMLGNCDNILSLNPGNPDDARLVTKRLDRIKDTDILNLGQYKLYSRVMVDGDKSPPFPMNTFAPYPPRRGEDEVLEKIDEILDEYGVKRETQGFSSEHILDRVGEKKKQREGSGSGTPTIRTENGEILDERKILESIYASHLDRGDINEWITTDEVREELERRYGDVGYDSKLSNILEGLPEKYVERDLHGGTVRIRLTVEGERVAFHQDTGRSASGGRDVHRLLLKRAYEAFHQLDYTVTLPEQIGENQPDGVAKPPINPFKEANNSFEEDELRKELKENYPQIVDTFGYDEIAIEAESTGETKPKQPLKNLAKAMRDGRMCVYVVKDGSEQKDEFTYHAERIEKILSDPPFVRSIKNEERFFYNTSRKIELSDGQSYALRDEGGDATWKDKNGILTLESEGETIAEFENPQDIKSPSKSKFEYHYTYDRSREAMVVRNKKGREVDAYTATKDKSARQRMLSDGYSLVYEPFIPEVEFPGEKLPNKDHWQILIIPDGHKDQSPQIYDRGQISELKGVEQQENISKEETENTDNPPDNTNNTSNKSTNEVVEESDEVWTKPKPGDDDYNPGKDNQNFRTGYDEEETGENWTGGQARDEDIEKEMKDYTPPDEKNNETNENDDNEDDDEDIPDPLEEW